MDIREVLNAAQTYANTASIPLTAKAHILGLAHLVESFAEQHAKTGTPRLASAVLQEAKRYRWIERHAMKHWTGTIGQPETWRLHGWPFNLIRGPEFGPGVDAAMLATEAEVKP